MDKSQYEERTGDVRNQSSLMWWILCSFFAPISIPYICFNIWARFKESQLKNSLPSKVVLITGASSGLGEALAHVFYRAGCKVVLAARREEELNRVRKELLEFHSTEPTHPPVILPLDLSDLNSLPECVEKILKIHGCIDILINNGGISVRADAGSTAIDVDVKVMLVNYFGAVALTKAVLPSMLKRKSGQIVFISSVQGKFAIPYRSAYSASKHATQAFADSLRAEVAEDGVKVLCVSPGYIKTSLSLNALTGSGDKYGVMDKTTESGTSPDKMARNILRAVLREEDDVVFAQTSAKLAYWLRFLCPPLYFWIMQRRALKLKAAS